MKNLSAVLPNGTRATRKTDRPYTHICAIRITDIPTGKVGTWWAQWSQTESGAAKMARSWQTCPAAKDGKITVETQVIPL